MAILSVLPLFAAEGRPVIEELDPPSTFAGGSLRIRGNDLVTEEEGGSSFVIVETEKIRVFLPADGTNEMLQVRIPEVLSGPVTLSVIKKRANGSELQSNPVPLVIQDDPEVIGIHSAQGPAGTPITLEGKHLGPMQGRSYVLFVGETKEGFRGSLRANVTSWNDTRIEAIVPDLAPGPADVRIVKMSDSNQGMLTTHNDQVQFLVLGH